MTVLDETLILEIVAVLADVGTDMSFETLTETYDPANGLVVESSVVSTTVKAAPPFMYEDQVIGTNGIQATDVQTIIAGNVAFTPLIGMDVVWGAEAFTITHITKYASGDDIAAYHLRLSH